MKKLFFLVAVAAAFALSTAPAMAAKPTDNGFDEFGYNYNARIFNGTGSSWCQGKLGWDKDTCDVYMGLYANDKLVMKWSKGWDDARFHGAAWTSDAWENNEWNGKVPGGSGAVWHYKIVWVGDYVADPSLIPEGGYGIWGEFATIMDQGTDPNLGPGHLWFAHANPTGYGAY